jgi:hypothetical protein
MRFESKKGAKEKKKHTHTHTHFVSLKPYFSYYFFIIPFPLHLKDDF